MFCYKAIVKKYEFKKERGGEGIGINNSHLKMYNIAYLPSALCHKGSPPTRLRRLKNKGIEIVPFLRRINCSFRNKRKNNVPLIIAEVSPYIIYSV